MTVGDRYPVPAGIYYDPDTDTFRVAADGRSTGFAFWQNWRNRAKDFPSHPDGATQ